MGRLQYTSNWLWQRREAGLGSTGRVAHLLMCNLTPPVDAEIEDNGFVHVLASLSLRTYSGRSSGHIGGECSLLMSAR